MINNYETRIVSVIVVPLSDNSVLSERSTTITITDEGGGEYIEISQPDSTIEGFITIDGDEWPELRAAIDRMIGECRDGVERMMAANNKSGQEET